MTTWDDLRFVLAQLRGEHPCPLVMYPNPRHQGKPPLRIKLAPWAAATAETLHKRFGDYVSLTVGTLPYPPARATHRPRLPDQTADPLHPDKVPVSLDGPAVVQSGHTLRHGLLIRNRTGAALKLSTSGQVTAVVVNPGTGRVVGGYCGSQRLPLLTVRVAPGATERLPLVIGTASFTPELGYAVPAGQWGIQATLELHSGQRRLTPLMPLTITA
jgi:hypothetical protein